MVYDLAGMMADQMDPKTETAMVFGKADGQEYVLDVMQVVWMVVYLVAYWACKQAALKEMKVVALMVRLWVGQTVDLMVDLQVDAMAVHLVLSMVLHLEQRSVGTKDLQKVEQQVESMGFYSVVQQAVEQVILMADTQDCVSVARTGDVLVSWMADLKVAYLEILMADSQGALTVALSVFDRAVNLVGKWDPSVADKSEAESVLQRVKILVVLMVVLTVDEMVSDSVGVRGLCWGFSQVENQVALSVSKLAEQLDKQSVYARVVETAAMQVVEWVVSRDI